MPLRVSSFGYTGGLGSRSCWESERAAHVMLRTSVGQAAGGDVQSHCVPRKLRAYGSGLGATFVDRQTTPEPGAPVVVAPWCCFSSMAQR